MAFPAQFNLSTLDGLTGFVINGSGPFNYAGGAVRSAGDVNNDGITDIIIGATSAGPEGAGSAYVVYGRSSGFDNSVVLSALDGSNGFELRGINRGDRAGYSVSGAGDVNADGIDDFIIGADKASPNGPSSGESYVVFGSAAGFEARIEPSSLNGENGFVVTGLDGDEFTGYSVSGVGDINNDGIDDLVISAPNFTADPEAAPGNAYVIFGQSSSFGSSFDISSLDGANGFILTGVTGGDSTGYSVSGIGDINNDGINDFAIGALRASINGEQPGVTYVVFGSDANASSQVELSSLNGTNGFAVNGIDDADSVGTSVEGVGDVNGDGIDDFVIGARTAEPFGAAYVLYGNASGFDANFELSDLDGTNGFVLNSPDGSGRFVGDSVSGAGDVNNDGFSDLLVGAPDAGNNGLLSGSAYVIFGRAAANDTVTTDEKSAVSGNVFLDNGNGVDTAFYNSSYVLTAVNGLSTDVGVPLTLASGALLTVGADGGFEYDPNGQFISTNSQSTAFDSFTYSISNSIGLIDAATVTIEIQGLNDSPVLLAEIADQRVEEQFTFTLPDSTFSDIDGDMLAYSATLADGSPLPDWLLFDPTTASFTGTSESDVVLSIKVTATDPDGAQATDTFDVTFAPLLPPEVEVSANGNPISDGSVTVREDNQTDFGTVNQGVAGIIKRYTVENNGEEPLFLDDLAVLGEGFTLASPFTQTVLNAGESTQFSVVLQTQSLGVFNGEVSFTNNDADEGIYTFAIQGQVVELVSNTPPIVANALTDVILPTDEPFTYTIPGDTFSDADGDSLVYSAMSANGNPLPRWLTFDQDTGTFSGSSNRARSIKVVVSATDPSGAVASEEVRLSFADVLEGTPRRDNLTGTDRPDIIRGLQSLDILRGEAGHDLIEGGGDRDTIYGGRGNDILFGSNQTEDALNDGGDIIYGDEGQDILVGGDGEDQLYGGNGNDLLIGEYLSGRNGRNNNDKLYGGNGKDTLIGGNGVDTMDGGNGDDVLYGGRGSDRMTGGRGRDTFVYKSISDASDLINDFNVRQDKLDLSAILANGNFNSANPFEDYFQFRQNGNVTEFRFASRGDAQPGFYQRFANMVGVNAADITVNNLILSASPVEGMAS